MNPGCTEREYHENCLERWPNAQHLLDRTSDSSFDAWGGGGPGSPAAAQEFFQPFGTLIVKRCQLHINGVGGFPFCASEKLKTRIMRGMFPGRGRDGVIRNHQL